MKLVKEFEKKFKSLPEKLGTRDLINLGIKESRIRYLIRNGMMHVYQEKERSPYIIDKEEAERIYILEKFLSILESLDEKTIFSLPSNERKILNRILKKAKSLIEN